MQKKPTRIQAVITDTKSKISTVVYLPHSRLPSIRAMAKAFAVSPSTVVEAYSRLVTEGVIYSRPGSGYYVSDPSPAPLSLADISPKTDRVIDPLWISRQSLEANATQLKPGCGWLPPDWLYEDGMRRGLRHVARADATVLGEYATPMGLNALRQLLVRRMQGLGIEADANQVMLTESGTQAIDLICRLLLKPGDTVVIDDPCYFNFQALLKAHRVNIVSVPYTPSGPDVDVFASVIQTHHPRLYITNSAIHNPTGATLSHATAYQVLKIAQQAGLYIVEDDIFADFEISPAPRLAALDGLSRVFYIGSFSKTLSASLRCGFIAAPTDLVEDIVDLKIATGFGGGQLAANVTLSALTNNGYLKHMREVQLRLAKARTLTIQRLAKLDIHPWVIPKAGLFLWCELPNGYSAAKLANQCLKKGVILAPGNAFSYAQNADSFVRFNVSQMLDAIIINTITKELEHGL